MVGVVRAALSPVTPRLTPVAPLTDAVEPADPPQAHELVAKGWACYSIEDLTGARRHWDAAFKAFRAADDAKGQAGVATNLGRLHHSLGNEAASRGWLARAGRLLERVGRCVEQGYLALALLACEIRDASALEESAALALELAMEFGDSDLEARALSDSGLALVSQGRVTEGFARLDEAMVPVIAGEVPNTAGAIFCSMLSACERAGEVRRAEEWIRLCQELVIDRLEGRFPVLHAHCRVVYGTLLCSAGRWSEAEAEILQAFGPSGTSMVARRSEAIARLADLRIHQGRLEEAAELLQPVADRFEAAESLARLHMARDEFGLAATIIRGVLDELGTDRLRGGPLLALLVQVELARGDVEAGDAAATRLTEFSVEAESPVLRAEAALAHGRVAACRGEPAQAVALFDTAQRELAHQERPALIATTRLELAQAAAAAGDAATAITQARAALATFERLGAERDADRTAAFLRRLGAPGRIRSQDRVGAIAALSRRERDVLELLALSLSNPEIAQRLFISAKTVEHHVGHILAKLGVRSRGEAAAFAAAADIVKS